MPHLPQVLPLAAPNILDSLLPRLLLALPLGEVREGEADHLLKVLRDRGELGRVLRAATLHHQFFG